MPTLRVVLRGIWEEHAPPSDAQRRAWCHPVYPSHVQRTIMRVVASVPGQPLRSLEERLDSSDADRVREHFRAAGWAWVVELGEGAQTLAEETWKQVAAPKAAVTMRDVSEWATGSVSRLCTEHAATPDREQMREVRERFLETRAGTAAQARGAARLSDAELTEHCQARYEELWALHGAESLGKCSPVGLGLGTLARPPWSGADGNWRSGTDRSLLSRYHRYFYPKAWVRDPASVAAGAGISAGQHISERLLNATACEIAGTELARACAPLGLRCAEHHALIGSVARGARDADLLGAYESRHAHPEGSPHSPEHRPTLARWAETERELGTEEDSALAEAVASYAERWCRWNTVAERFVESVDRAGQLDWHVQVELGVLRRLWHIVHGREVEWEVPFIRAELPRVLRGVFQKHLSELVKRPIVDPRGGPPIDPIHQDREQNTLRALARNSPTAVNELIALISLGDERWLAMYREITDGQGCFMPEEFRRWVANQLGQGDEDGDPWT